MHFENLKEMIYAITKNKLKDIDIPVKPGERNTLINQLYDGISKGKFKSDEDAAAAIFQSNAKDARYKRLRQRLIRQLINVVFFIDVNQSRFSNYASAVSNIYQDYTGALAFIDRYAYGAGNFILLQTLEQAVRWELTHLCADITWHLRKNAALTGEDRANRIKYAQLNQLYERKRYWETKSADYFDTIIDQFGFDSNKAPTQELYERTKVFYEELSEKSEEVDTCLYYYYTGIIGIIMYVAANDHRAAIGVIDKTLAIFDERKAINRARVLAIAFQKPVCLLQLREHETPAWKEAFDYLNDLVEPYTNNWLKFRSLETYQAFYTRNYDKAFAIYKEVMAKSILQKYPGRAQDDWRLHNGYIHLLAQLGVLPLKEVEAVSGSFKLSRFVNDFEMMFRDKEGMNIPVLFLPILYNLAIGNNEELAPSFEALEKYRQRYLNNDTNRRSAVFLKILLALAERPYDRNSADRKIEKELAVLRTLRPEGDRQLFVVEVIPYEHLLELLKVPL
jgi:hypothetical protein